MIILEENRMADDEARKRIRAMAHRVFDNDGIEEFVPELVGFAEVICPHANPKELKPLPMRPSLLCSAASRSMRPQNSCSRTAMTYLTAVLEGVYDSTQWGERRGHQGR
jgi:hypothetical protein